MTWRVLWEWAVLLAGVGLAGMVIATCIAYRRSHRMHHVLPLGISYLLLVTSAVASYWLCGRSWLWWQGLALAAAYGSGAWGLLRLLATSVSLPGRRRDH